MSIKGINNQEGKKIGESPSLSRLLAYKERIYEDSIDLWESPQLMQYFTTKKLHRIRNQWRESTLEWLYSELCKREEEPKQGKSLNKMYFEYLAHFRKLADKMVEKQRIEVIDVTLAEYKQEMTLCDSSDDESKDEQAMLMAVLHRASLHGTDASSLTYRLVRDHPHALLALIQNRW